MRKKDIERILDQKASRSEVDFMEHRLSELGRNREVADLRREITKLRDLLDEVIEPGYVLSKKADRGLLQLPPGYMYAILDSRYRELAKSESKPTTGTYEIRRRISNELIATFANRYDADVFIGTLDGPCENDTGEEESE